MKRYLFKWIAGFLLIMTAGTVVSRMIWQQGTAVVTTARPQSRALAFELRAPGYVEELQDIAVRTLPDQMVDSVYVREGEHVQKGDVLFTVDTGVLAQQIRKRKQELEKQELQIRDQESSLEAARQRRANAQAQAEEAWSLGAARAGTQLEKAQSSLQKAQEAYEACLSKWQNTPSEDILYAGETADPASEQFQYESEDGILAQLEKDCETAREAYEQAQQERKSLEWRMEQAVFDAQQKKNIRAQVEAVESSHTYASWEEPLSEETLPEEPFPELLDETIWDETILDEPIWDETILDETILDETILDEMILDEMILDETILDEAILDEAILDEPSLDEPFFDEGVLEESGFEESIFEDTERAGLDVLLEQAFAKEKAALQAWNTAEQNRTQYLAGLETAQEQDRLSELEKLAAALESAQETYQEAWIASNEANITGRRGVLSAALPEGENHAARLLEITRQQMEEELEELEALQQQNGAVFAPSDGRVLQVNVSIGEKTQEICAVKLADLTSGTVFRTKIREEEAGRKTAAIGTGDLVTIETNSQMALEELPVSSMRQAGETEWELTVKLPEHTMEIGTAATLFYSAKSRMYGTCVPLSALHVDEQNRTYVLVPGKEATIMGEEEVARKQLVVVLEKNEQFAALEEGALSAAQEVIISSDRSVEAGTRIRTEGQTAP